MKITDMFPRRYLCGADLDGREFDVTIAKVVQEPMRNKNTKKIEKKWVIYFAGAQKGLVLNWTVANKIADHVGSDRSEDWPGKRVRLYPTTIHAFGKDHLVVRVKAALNGATTPVDDLSVEPDEVNEDWWPEDEVGEPELN